MLETGEEDDEDDDVGRLETRKLGDIVNSLAFNDDKVSVSDITLSSNIMGGFNTKKDRIFNFKESMLLMAFSVFVVIVVVSSSFIFFKDSGVFPSSFFAWS